MSVAESRSAFYLRLWLASILLMVAAMILIGGITRLTRSGLSIVEWRPVTGIVPPLNEAQWERAFAAYRESPEFKKRNSHFALADFKTIFFWEYVHRLWGRLIGLAVFFPGLGLLLLRRRESARFDPALLRLWAFLLVGGGLQGLLGWYMVQSGLVNIPRVSHYRLAAHLWAALLLEAYILWQLMNRWPANPAAAGGATRSDSPRAGVWRAALIGFGALLALQILFGAFTAGIRAGYIHNTFPTMSGSWIPDGLGTLRPFYRNFLENHVTIQFTHRILGWAVFFAAGGLLWWGERPSGSRERPSGSRERTGLRLCAAAAGLQFVLGAATVMLSVPVWLGVAHQAGALLLFNAYLFTLHAQLRSPNAPAPGQ